MSADGDDARGPVYVARASLLAAAFLAASLIGLVLKPDGDFGSPFWPAAGIALGGLIVGGLRLWPAILVAALAEAAWSLGRMSPAIAGSDIAAVAAAAGIGATLQAIAGAFAVRGGRGRFAFPIDDGRLFKLFLVSGAACSVVNSSILTGTLWGMGLVDSDSAPWLWITMWTGDATGVFLVAPLVLLWFGQGRDRRLRRLATFGVPLVLFVAVATVIAAQMQASERLRWRKDFQRQAQAAADDARDQFNGALEVLYGARGLFDASDDVHANEFEQYISLYLTRRPALLAVAWTPRISQAKREEFQDRLAARGRGNTIVVEFVPGGEIVPAKSRPEYFPVKFAKAQRTNAVYYGLDLVCLEDWRKAAESACAKGEAIVASPFPIHEPDRRYQAILAFLPVYAKGAAPANPAERRARLQGYVAALIDGNALLEHISTRTSDNVAHLATAANGRDVPLAIEMFGSSDDGATWESVARAASGRSPSSLDVTEAFTVQAAGREWRFEIGAAEPAYHVASRDRWRLLLGGTLSGALLGAFTLVLASRSARVEELVQERTRELAREVAVRRRAEAAAKASEAWLQLAQDAAGIGVWEWDCATNEVHASASHWRLFGRADLGQPTTGDTWISFLHPDDQEPTREAGVRAMRDGNEYATETRVVWPDGTLRLLRHEGRIDRDAQGQPFRIAGASWDITADREQAAAIEEQQRRFRALTENSEIGFWQVAPDGRASYLNAAICKLLEVERPEDAMDSDTSEFFAPESQETLRRERETRKRGLCSTYEATIVGRRGRRSNVMISAAPILDADGRLQSTIGSYIDITELKGAEARLKASENELASIYHGVSDAVSLWNVVYEGHDELYRCSRVNRAALAIFGIAEDQLVGKLLPEIVPRPIRDTLRACARQAVDRREGVDVLQTIDIPSGRRTFDVRFTPLFCEKGNCTHLLVAAHDVTARVEAERELRRAIEFRDSIIEHASEGLCISQVIEEPPYVRFSLWNKQMEEITGFTIDDVNRRGWLDLLFPDGPVRTAMQTVRERVNCGEDYRDEIANLTRADGQTRITRFSTTPLGNANGEKLVLTFVRDVTEQERAIEALRTSEDRYRGVVSAMAEGVLMVDEFGVVEACNASLCKILGMPESQILGRRVLELFAGARDEYGEPFDESNCAVMLALTTGVSRERRTLQIPQPGGQTRWLAANTRPIFDPLGRPKAAVATITDVTSLKVAATRLRAHEQQLAHVSRVSTMGEFVAGIAHEINQPLHAIANFANACERSLTEKNAGEAQIANALAWTRHINASVRQAATVIRRLRDFFRRETAKRESTSLGATVRESLDLTSFLVKEHGVAIDLDLGVGDDRLEIDRVQIQQVLVNLIRNAIEAVASLPRERRRAAVRLVPRTDGIEVIVSDSGPGVPPEEVSRLFEPFHTTKPDGMGMGLAISKTIVESHGGEIWYAPHADGNGHGGEFHFTLPKFAPRGEDMPQSDAQAQLTS